MQPVDGLLYFVLKMLASSSWCITAPWKSSEHIVSLRQLVVSVRSLAFPI